MERWSTPWPTFQWHSMCGISSASQIDWTWSAVRPPNGPNRATAPLARSVQTLEDKTRDQIRSHILNDIYRAHRKTGDRDETKKNNRSIKEWGNQRAGDRSVASDWSTNVLTLCNFFYSKQKLNGKVCLMAIHIIEAIVVYSVNVT